MCPTCESLGLPWHFHGTAVLPWDITLFVSEIKPMGLLWHLCGTSMGLPSDSHGASMGLPRDALETSVGLPLDVHGIYVGLAWAFRGIPIRLPWDFHGICMKTPCRCTKPSYIMCASEFHEYDSHKRAVLEGSVI